VLRQALTARNGLRAHQVFNLTLHPVSALNTLVRLQAASSQLARQESSPGHGVEIGILFGHGTHLQLFDSRVKFLHNGLSGASSSSSSNVQRTAVLKFNGLAEAYVRDVLITRLYHGVEFVLGVEVPFNLVFALIVFRGQLDFDFSLVNFGLQQLVV
jgi:hypothetical protein